MKIKELFKSMEKANQFAEMVGDFKCVMAFASDDYSSHEFDGWKAFEKHIKEEYAKWYIVALLEQEIELDGRGCGDCNFECDEPMTRFNGKKFQSSIHVAIYRKENY